MPTTNGEEILSTGLVFCKVFSIQQRFRPIAKNQNKMKLQALFLLVAIALTEAKFEIRTPDDAAAAHHHCQMEIKVSDELFEKLLRYEFPDRPSVKSSCYIKCFVEQMGLFDERKGFDEKAIIKQFTHSNPKNLAKVQHGLEKCIDHNEWESDNCTWADRVFSCWIKINRQIVRKEYGEN